MTLKLKGMEEKLKVDAFEIGEVTDELRGFLEQEQGFKKFNGSNWYYIRLCETKRQLDENDREVMMCSWQQLFTDNEKTQNIFEIIRESRGPWVYRHFKARSTEMDKINSDVIGELFKV